MKRKFEKINMKELNDFIIEYEYNKHITEKSNIEIFKKDLNKFLSNNKSLTSINLDSDYSDNMISSNSSSWKFKAIFEVIKHDKMISELSFTINKDLDIHVANSLNDTLITNNHIRQVAIVDNIGISYEWANIITSGIRANSAVKQLNLVGNTSSTVLNLILEALINNNGIKFLHIENKHPNEEYIEKLSVLIKQNPNIIDLNVPMSGVENLTIESLTHLFKTLAKNNCIGVFNTSPSLLYKYDYNMNFEKTLQDFYNNKTICEFNNDHFTYSSDTDFSHGDMLSIFKRNKAKIEKLAKDLDKIDLGIIIPEHIKPLIDFDKIGKSLLQEKLKCIHHDYKLQNDFDGQASILDNKLDIEKAQKIKNIENYRTDYFFHLKGVTKNICKVGLVQEIWSKIASYCELENSHSTMGADNAQVLLAGADHEGVVG